MCQRQTWMTLTPKEPQRSWNPTGKGPNLTYRREKNHDVTIDAKHGLWTSQRAVRQPDIQQKGSSQLSFVWGMNVTQFSCCIASNGFSGSDYSGDESTFHSVADLDRQDVMSKHLVLPQRLELFLSEVEENRLKDDKTTVGVPL